MIPPTSLIQNGSGIELEEQSVGITIQMSDPVSDLAYARNAVTMEYDLSGAVTARLQFEAMEFGDEPHAPPPGPFGDDVNFDGVAISEDGVDWYEIQDLRSLRSDRFTAYDLDLNALAAGVGLTLGSGFLIRFCQYDNNPAPKDGIFVRAIAVEGDLRAAILHLPMDDNAANPTVADAAAGGNDQTFLDPGGDPNTDAHSAPGVVGTALAFDGVDDQIDLGADVDAALGAGQDFAVAFWWARGAGNDENNKRIFNKAADNGTLIGVSTFTAVPATQNTSWIVVRSQTPDERSTLTATGVGYDWNHYVFQRRGSVVELWVNGTLADSDATAGNERDFSGTGGFLLGGFGTSFAMGTMDDFRVYDRALFAGEIGELAGA